MPNRDDLKTLKQRKDFIGDDAEKFSVQESVINPIWDGSKYIKDINNKDLEKKELKRIREESLSNCTVELNGNVYQTRPSDEPNFRLRIAGLESGQETKWILENDETVTVSKEELEEVFNLGLLANGAIWDDYMQKKEQL